MSEASGVVQRALEQVAVASLSSFSARDLSNKLVVQTWHSRLDLFEGKDHLNLNRVSIAAASLASGFRFFPDDEDGDFIFLALGQLLIDISSNGHRYSFKPVDHNLIAFATKAYMSRAEQTKDRTDAIVSSFGL